MKFIYLSLFLSTSLSLSYLNKIERDSISRETPYYESQETFQDTLIRAHQWVESRNDVFSKNKESSARGILQILKGTVDDVNRITNNNFTYQDRYDSLLSVDMYRVYQDHYNKEGDIKKSIYLWRYGPGYMYKQEKDYYYREIMQHVERQRQS